MTNLNSTPINIKYFTGADTELILYVKEILENEMFGITIKKDKFIAKV